MAKKCLIIVPHADDEINIGAGIFEYLHANNIFTEVVFTTNSDYNYKEAELRYRELLKAKQYLGYDAVTLLGYADGYNGKHIYETEDNEVAISKSNHTATYNIGNTSCYHFSKYGVQTGYNKTNYKNDLKDLLIERRPDIIICIDIDKNIEHRALSLIFDEAIGEILKITNYRPIILKKFAYTGVWAGPEDYFNNTMEPTCHSFLSTNDETLVFPYLWNNMIRIRMPEKEYPILFWKSNIYKALSCYKSQKAILNFTRIVNSDIVFWHRRVDGLHFISKITASSGNVVYLNDFKITDTDNIRSDSVRLEQSQTKCWKPSAFDIRPKITYDFGKPSEVYNIVIYTDSSNNINIKSITIKAEDCNPIKYQAKKQNNIISIQLNELIKTKKIELSFERENVSVDICVYEIEIYSKKQDDNDELFVIFEQYDNTNLKERKSLLLILSSITYQVLMCFKAKKITLFTKHLIKKILRIY